MNDIPLLPCPFCGAPGELFQDTSSDYERNWTWVWQCSNHYDCWIEGPMAMTKEAAAALWNRRLATVKVSSQWTIADIEPVASGTVTSTDSGGYHIVNASGY